jgi:large subunit ribosomal protein L13
MKKTFIPSQKDIKHDWHLVDADNKVLGKVASDIAILLTGKNKPTYTPNTNVGDNVVVINAEKISVSGNKMKNKVYHRVTGYPGGVKSETLEKLLSRRPTEVVRRAVYGMLPSNKLRNERMNNLYIYKGPQHPHQGQLGK